jgi:predicted RNA binding protein YcfA (HicA-like mRNA interferase family)
MGSRKYPPLTPSEVIEIVVALGFRWKRKKGSHHQYERPADGNRQRSVVTVDDGVDQFDDFLLKNMIEQSNFSRDQVFRGYKKICQKGWRKAVSC